jgi:uncharacterized protein with HEPN domain
LTAIAEIQQSTANLTFEDFASDRHLIKAVLYDYLVIGEASNNIPTNVQLLAATILWRQMADMRNIMVHEYFQINLEIVWDSIQHDLPELVLKLHELLEQQVEE